MTNKFLLDIFEPNGQYMCTINMLHYKKVILKKASWGSREQKRNQRFNDWFCKRLPLYKAIFYKKKVSKKCFLQPYFRSPSIVIYGHGEECLFYRTAASQAYAELTYKHVLEQIEPFKFETSKKELLK